MNNDNEFDKCVEYIKNSEKMNIDNDTKLYFYAHYKQSLHGDCNIQRPVGLFNLSEKLKYNAWNNLKGLSKTQAKKNYIDKFNEIVKN